ncbi:uncharacterized protein LOC124271298 [Haliotis rubra]|uniref:uncharacterized protein LOC124271298 n=1 Tax=Haliotis rubra TaxID=36100 RepID=UPI001EE51B0F|nr:uncharacterized protein LOC124271298 [Haliotis rubra]
MLLLFVAGIIAMLCLPLPGVGAAGDRDALLYKVEILIPPKEGRDENADIQQIKQTVEDLKDIKVIFAFKELGNPSIVLVLDVEEACSWPQLTGFLSRKGYEFSVASLYRCSDYSNRLGFNLPDDAWTYSFQDENLAMVTKVFPVGDLSTLEYNERLKMTFQQDLAILKSGQKGVCFRILAEYPVELVYFAPVSQMKVEAIDESLASPGLYENEVKRIQNLANYTAVCQGD